MNVNFIVFFVYLNGFFIPIHQLINTSSWASLLLYIITPY